MDLKDLILHFLKFLLEQLKNAILAAFYATGKTTINNCAIEPEVIDLIIFLNKLGGKILVKGRKISIHGSKKIKKNYP